MGSTVHPILRQREKDWDQAINEIDRSALASIYSSLSWIKTTISSTYTLRASYLQQRVFDLCVEYIIKQNTFWESLEDYKRKHCIHAFLKQTPVPAKIWYLPMRLVWMHMNNLLVLLVYS